MPGDDGEGTGGGSSLLSARLLVASARMGDPNFERGVILVLDHSYEGALGIVLNRPTGLGVEEVLGPWHDQALQAPPGVVFSGGPVSRDAVIGLARSPVAGAETGRAGTVAPAVGSEAHRSGRWRPVLGQLGTVDLSVPPEDQPLPLAGARLYSGYAGWSTGQLEEEIAEGAWYVTEAIAQDVFCVQPERLWHDVLKRQGGELAVLAAFPPHPSVN
ncbi:MAG TPA: YqgE/AlgH family protein [Acidimicrobiales bacterium]|nr:YqgE/AlgH family protein [Acidimicrobiales bacterium]